MYKPVHVCHKLHDFGTLNKHMYVCNHLTKIKRKENLRVGQKIYKWDRKFV